MNCAIKCFIAAALIGVLSVPQTVAQEIKADPVSVKTVIGQKYAVTMKIIDIDLDQAKQIGFELVPGSNHYDNKTDIYATTEFQKVLDCLSQVGIAKAMDASTVVVLSNEAGESQVSGEKIVVIARAIDDYKFDFYLRHTSASHTFRFQAMLGQTVLLKPSMRRLDSSQRHVQWIIASVAYASQEQTEQE
jgi:hypothetical protein